MYHHLFLFEIVSGNSRIEEIFREILPLKDCNYSFKTVCSAEDLKAAENLEKPDVAFLYDSIEGIGLLKSGKEHAEHILIAENGASLLTDKNAAASVSEIWVMPENDKYNKELLTIHFNRLAERMKRRADARKQEICFKTLIDSVPDISWFKDVSGAHLIVNDSFCEMVGKTKEQIYKKGHCYIWDASKEDEEVCLNSDRIIMDSRTTNSFEENVKIKDDMRMLKSYKSALIDVDGEVFGTCGIAHDVTELKNMDTELDIVLESVPFAILVEDVHGIVLNKNTRFDKYFPQFTDIVGKPSEIWKKSLSKKMLLEDRLMEIVIQNDEEKRVLVFEEEPIHDIFGREMGQIVTLTDITLEWSISQENKQTANTDYLTGLANRRSLMNHLANIHNRDDVTLIMIDLDNFKLVNDNFGHEAGDKALIKTAALLKESFKDDLVVRMGGDEFMVVVCGKSMAEVKNSVNSLMGTMHKVYQESEEFRSITASIGVLSTSTLPEHKRSMSELLRSVDELLYEAKKNGKDRYCVYGDN